MEDFEPLGLSQALRRTAEAWRRWRRQLKSAGASELDPFLRTRYASGRTAFQEISALTPDHPLRLPLLRWIYRLAEQRINAPLLERIAWHYHHEQHASECSATGLASARTKLHAALGPEGRSREWLDDLFATSGDLSLLVGLLWERRAEIAQRMGVATVSGLEWPDEASNVALLATHWLTRTQAIADGSVSTDWQPLLTDALGRTALSGWPARLQPRSLLDLFDAPELLRGLELDPGPLPELLAPASFLRGLARLGASWADAAGPKTLPFVVAHDAYGLRRLSAGALFGMLPWGDAFAKRQLGLGAGVLAKHRRALGKVVLIESRQAALRVLLRQAALRGAKELHATQRELSECLLGRAIAPSAAGVYWRPRNDSQQRFAALLLAAEQAQSLTQRHNEDWFRNPRAHEQLRCEVELPPAPSAPSSELERGADTLFAELCQALS